jgi:hypothetical protein
MVKWTNAALAAVLLALGCARNINNKDAVRQGVLDYLDQRKGQLALDTTSMNVNIANVAFHNDEADATVAFEMKGNSGPPMSMNYVLQRKGDKWVVKGRKESGLNPHGGGQGLPGSVPGSPSGALPPGHPPTTPPAK